MPRSGRVQVPNSWLWPGSLVLYLPSQCESGWSRLLREVSWRGCWWVDQCEGIWRGAVEAISVSDALGQGADHRISVEHSARGSRPAHNLCDVEWFGSGSEYVIDCI